MARSSSTDRRFLEQHGGKWRVVVSVPRKLQKQLGTKLKVSLHTDSLAVANRMKWAIVAKLKDRINKAQEGDTRPQHIAQALAMAEMLKAAASIAEQEAIKEGISITGDQLLGPAIGEDFDPDTGQPEPVYDPERERQAGQFVRIALGIATPIDLHHDQYLEGLTVRARTKADDVRSMKYLKDWCEKESVEPVLQSFNRKMAVRFMDGLQARFPRHSPVTLNKYLRRLSRYWQWLLKRQEVESNIWHGLTLSVPQVPYDEEERPFTDDEMKRLLSGETTQHMHDLMRIGALTGARLDVIVSLKVKDTLNDNFVFKPQKKEKKPRLCPIHPSLAPILQRRTSGKDLEDDLFPEWPAPKNPTSQRERSFKASNQFTEYRRQVGVDHIVEGKRRSLVNFHSFRRWFITKAEQADQPENIIAAVVGHKREGITLGVYSKGPLLEQCRRCVEAVNLPNTNDKKH